MGADGPLGCREAVGLVKEELAVAQRAAGSLAQPVPGRPLRAPELPADSQFSVRPGEPLGCPLLSWHLCAANSRDASAGPLGKGFLIAYGS